MTILLDLLYITSAILISVGVFICLASGWHGWQGGSFARVAFLDPWLWVGGVLLIVGLFFWGRARKLDPVLRVVLSSQSTWSEPHTAAELPASAAPYQP
jgi:hypothetical protein